MKRFVKPERMDVDSEPREDIKANMANAIDLSESEDEAEMEDIIDNFRQASEPVCPHVPKFSLPR